MEHLPLIIAITFLFTGVFLLKKIWLGALAGGAAFAIGKWLSAGELLSVPFFNALVISSELVLLIFGAYFFYRFLHARGQLHEFTTAVSAFPSRFSIVLIFCLYFGSFMEGLAGFGIPAMLIAPVLLSLGFKPLTSVALPLAANTVSVNFGALGTPIKVGLGIAATGPVAKQVILFNALPILILPFALAFIYSVTEQEKIHWVKEWKMLTGAGIFYFIPFALTGYFSLQFPSVIAGLAGIMIFTRVFIPKAQRPPLKIWLTTFYPYLVFVLLLVAANLLMGNKNLSFHPEVSPISLYQPGVVFIIAIVLITLFSQQPGELRNLPGHGRETFTTLRYAVITIISLVCFARFIQSDLSATISSLLNRSDGSLLPIFAQLTGIAGSFVTGSATMGNLLFQNSFTALHVPSEKLAGLMALLNTGCAYGNAISLQNIVMTRASVQHQVSASRIISLNLLLVILLAAFALMMVYGIAVVSENWSCCGVSLYDAGMTEYIPRS